MIYNSKPRKVFFILTYILILILALCGVNAIDYDNISFTNEEFFNGTVTATAVIELSNGGIAVGYVNTGDFYLETCDSDGTNCVDENPGINPSGVNSISIFQSEDGTIHAILGATGFLRHARYNSTGHWLGQSFPQNATASYISAVQINSTDFAIAYQDTADSSKGKVIICKLDGSSCGSENALVTTDAITYNDIILQSNGVLGLAFTRVGDTLYEQHNVNNGTYIAGSWQSWDASSSWFINIIEGSDNKIKAVYQDRGNSNKGTFTTSDLDGTGLSSEVVFETGNSSYFNINELDNKLFITYQDATSGKGTSINMNLTGGDISSESVFDSVITSGISAFISNTTKQLIISYTDITNSKGDFAISEAFIPSAIVTINEPITSSYVNINPFTLNVTTDLNTNLTYSLNGASNVTLGSSNINSSYSNITGVEGSNTIIVYSNYSGEISSATSTFIIDTTLPVINNNLLSEYNSYTFNPNSSCTDTYFDYCNISIDGQNVALNSTSITLTHNGNISYNITGVDLAGNNITESGVIFVNPPQYFYFQLSNGTSVTNFTFGGADYIDYATIYVYGDSLVLGNNTLLFEKLGYVSINVTDIIINTTSNINLTTNVSNSLMTVNIYDRVTGILINETVSITLVATYGYNSTTTTGTLNISSLLFINESYQIIASSTNYASESVYFDYDNRYNLEVNIYMIRSNQTNYGTHTVKVITDTGLLINNAVCSVLEWKPALSAFISVAQGVTDSTGETLLNIELGTKLYKFECTKGTNSATSSNKIIASNGLTTALQLATTITTYQNIFDGLTYSLINTSYNSTHQRITFQWTNLNGLTDIGCLKIYKVIGTKYTELQSSCVSSSSSSIQLIQNINVTYEIRAVSSINIDGVVTNLDYIVFEPTNSISTVLKEYGLDVLIPLLFVLIGFSIGFLLEPKNIYISIITTIVMVWFSLLIVPSVISATICSFVTLICGLMFWGAYKFK